jgi:hypothetical protein
LIKAGDILILALAAAGVGASYGAFWASRGAGHSASITVGRQVVEQVALDTDRELTVQGAIGVSHLTVHDGRIRFTESPCPGRYCIHAGWLSHTGQVAACLPNGIVVEILGDEREYDAINL